jgi:hypothetical protein
MLKLSGAIVFALLVIVGAIGLGYSLTDSESPGVFDGLTASDLAGSGITIRDPNPPDQPAVSRDNATRSVLIQAGVTAEASQLIRVNFSGGGSIRSSLVGEFLVWAIRLDTSGSDVSECFGTSRCFATTAIPTIAFVNANTGDYLGAFVAPGTPSPVSPGS